MSSAIMSVPNAGVGELLVGYPSTAIATNAATESGRMQLRCYLGSVLYRPEDVLILPDVAFDGFVGAEPKTYTQGEFDVIIGSTGDVPDEDQRFIDERIMPYECSLWSPGGSLYRTNAGHLGDIDSPEQYHKVYGCNVYSNEPNPASTTRPIVVETNNPTAAPAPANLPFASIEAALFATFTSDLEGMLIDGAANVSKFKVVDAVEAQNVGVFANFPLKQFLPSDFTTVYSARVTALAEQIAVDNSDWEWKAA
jgi:hypothetical protein